MTAASAGLALVAPYAAAALAALAAAALAAFVLRARIAHGLAAASREGSPGDGAVTVCVLAVLTILVFFAAVEIAAAAGFVAGLPLHPWVLAVAAAAAAGALAAAARALVPRERAVKASLAALGVCVVLAGASVAWAGLFVDVSWDGQWYHQSAVVALAEGWNPVRDPEGIAAGTGEWSPDRTPGAIWDFAVTHYAKGGWVRQAALYQAARAIEYAKAGNVLFLAVQVLAWAAVALRLAPGRWRLAGLAGLLMAVNPPIVVQALSFKNDGQLGSLFAVAVALGCLALSGAGGWPALLALCAALLMLATIKFTGLVYAVILAVGFAALLVAGKGLRSSGPAVAAMLATLLLAVVFVGYNPYVQNTLDHGHPFHPLMGKDAVDNISNQWPSDFPGTSSAERLFLSLFSRAMDEAILEPGGEPTHLKIPFTIGSDEIRPYMGFDTRVAGFGPLFGGALLLSLVLLTLLVLDGRRGRPPLLAGGLAVVAVLVATVLANPQSWWARYAPQIWMVPVLIAGLGLLVARRRSRAVLARAVCAVLLVDAAFVASVNFANVVNGTAEVTAALEEIATWPRGAALEQGDFDVTWTKFDERAIPWSLARRSGETSGGLTIPYTTVTAYPR